MYDRILVVVDGSPAAEWVLDEAIQFVQKLGSELAIAHVIDNSYLMCDVGHTDADASTEALAKQGDQIVADARAKAEKAGVHVHSVVVDDPIGTFGIGTAIEQTAHNVDVQALMLDMHGRRGFRRLFLGSVVESVMRRSALPVLPVRVEPTETSRASTESPSNVVIA